MIIYIHGYNSSGEGEKFKKLQKMFPDIEVLSPSYNSKDFNSIDTLLDDIDLDGDTLFIGCSLGGFLAMHFAHKYNAKSILLNPVTNALFQLKVLLEKQKKELSTADYQAMLYNFCKLKKYAVQNLESTSVSVFVNKDDDVIHYQDTLDFFKNKRSVKLFEFGGHRFSELEKIKNDIEFIYYQL